MVAPDVDAAGGDVAFVIWGKWLALLAGAGPAGLGGFGLLGIGVSEGERKKEEVEQLRRWWCLVV